MPLSSTKGEKARIEKAHNERINGWTAHYWTITSSDNNGLVQPGGADQCASGATGKLRGWFVTQNMCLDYVADKALPHDLDPLPGGTVDRRPIWKSSFSDRAFGRFEA
jgi:hypothetical protein